MRTLGAEIGPLEDPAVLARAADGGHSSPPGERGEGRDRAMRATRRCGERRVPIRNICRSGK